MDLNKSITVITVYQADLNISAYRYLCEIIG